MLEYWGLHLLCYKEKNYDVYCVGKTNLDLFYYIDQIKLEENHIANEFYYFAGGKATNVAINLSKFGLKVGLISVIGNDVFGKVVLNILSEKNIDFLGKKVNETTSLTSIIVDKFGKNTMFHNIGANSKLSSDLIPKKIPFSFVQSGIPTDTIIKAINNSKISFLELSETSQFEMIKPLLKKIKFVSLNENELNNIFKTNNTEKNLHLLSNFSNNILLKIGEKGLIFLDEKGKVYMVPAKKTDVINTTGAGDAISAAFIYGFLKKWEIPEILRFCVKFASQIIKSKYST
ncbi:MAG: carbohydrate kinase family protein [Thermosipho sp. (in: Bacteria)]|nr:carbohydrate kinase family protein [Thermosipho sp. (in: thermotogales)]